MVFSSVSFLFYFLPVVLLAYFLVRPAWRNFVLLLSGLVFYLWGAGEIVFILMLSIALNWVFGLMAAAARDSGERWRRNLPVIASVIVNLGILGYFKYTNFFVAQINHLGEITRAGFMPVYLAPILLPIGVSFFTFQAMSYVIDVAQGRVEPLQNPVDFGMYIAMFPQLVAGPIVRYHEIAPQIHRRGVTWEGFSAGMVRFIHGLVKKVVFADSIGLLADQAFKAPERLSAAGAWLGLLAFTIQVYFDFSGYSDMAIGLGQMFGFRLPENFNRPYSAVSFTDFWRRWHMTLSHWFRDYVYIPLGGSRRGPWRTYLNLVIVFFLVGFWHGANWTFVVFGLYHGFWMSLERATGRRFAGEMKHPLVRRALTFFLILLGMTLFRAENMHQAWTYYQTLFGLRGGTQFLAPGTDWQGLVFLALGSLVVFLPDNLVVGRLLEQSEKRAVAWMRLGLATVALTFAIMLIVSRNYTPFIYFQF